MPVRTAHELVEAGLQIGEPARSPHLGVDGPRPLLPCRRALRGGRDPAGARLLVGGGQARELALDRGEPRAHCLGSDRRSRSRLAAACSACADAS